MADAWRAEGERGIRQSLGSLAAGRQSVLVRWVWFDANAAQEFRPAAPVEQLAAAVIREHVPIETDEPGGACLRVYWPVAIISARQGGLEFTRPMTELLADEHEIVRRIAALIGGMLLISGLLAVILGIRLVGRPLEQLVAKARRVGDGDLEGPVHFHSRDELAELAESLNAMCAKLAESLGRLQSETASRIAALEQLRHGDRLKTVGRLASGIAHELGTPLNVVAGRAEFDRFRQARRRTGH